MIVSPGGVSLVIIVMTVWNDSNGRKDLGEYKKGLEKRGSGIQVLDQRRGTQVYFLPHLCF